MICCDFLKEVLDLLPLAPSSYTKRRRKGELLSFTDENSRRLIGVIFLLLIYPYFKHDHIERFSLTIAGLKEELILYGDPSDD
jgi:hypothetical protein